MNQLKRANRVLSDVIYGNRQKVNEVLMNEDLIERLNLQLNAQR